MRILFINNHCITDPTAGVACSLWTILRWLAAAGHEVQALTTARFESPVPFTIEQHLAGLNTNVRWDHDRKSQQAARRGAKSVLRRVARFKQDGVGVTLLMTRANDEAVVDARELTQYSKLFAEVCSKFVPEQVVACNAHSMIRQALAAARSRGAVTLFAVRGYGYDCPSFFADVHHVFTCSKFLTRHFYQRTGLSSTPLDPPLDWSQTLAGAGSRKFLTFVNPSPHKGAMWFAGLAGHLGRQRPDIPILVVQSGRTAALLNSIPGVDFKLFPQIMAAPPTATPAEYLALTRALLVPSVWDEPFGRVAAEAMINGIPPLVSNRGALPDVVCSDAASGPGGLVLPIPSDFTRETTSLPTPASLQSWFNAVCRLWDDQPFYDRLASQARRLASQRYSEDRLRTDHLDYFTGLPPASATLPERELPDFRPEK